MMPPFLLVNAGGRRGECLEAASEERVIERRRSAAKAFAEDHRGLFDGMQLRGLSRRAMVDELNRLGIKGPRGGKWSLCQVQRIGRTSRNALSECVPTNSVAPSQVAEPSHRDVSFVLLPGNVQQGKCAERAPRLALPKTCSFPVQ